MYNRALHVSTPAVPHSRPDPRVAAQVSRAGPSYNASNYNASNYGAPSYGPAPTRHTRNPLQVDTYPYRAKRQPVVRVVSGNRNVPLQVHEGIPVAETEHPSQRVMPQLPRLWHPGWTPSRSERSSIGRLVPSWEEQELVRKTLGADGADRPLQGRWDPRGPVHTFLDLLVWEPLLRPACSSHAVRVLHCRGDDSGLGKDLSRGHDVPCVFRWCSHARHSCHSVTARAGKALAETERNAGLF